jgi:HNH endonuclease
MKRLWAPEALFERCIKCGTTEFEHKGHGLCFKCYHIEKNLGKLTYWKERGKKFKKWSNRYDRCIKCGNTDRPHASRGRCDRCWKEDRRRKSGVREKPNNFRISRWSYNYDACISCGTSDRQVRQNRHAGNGLCMRCTRRLVERRRKGINEGAGCQICGWNRDTVDACHLVPTRAGGALDTSNIVLLCPNHHRLLDRGKLSAEEMMKLHEKVAGAVWHGINSFLQVGVQRYGIEQGAAKPENL